jgi:hypothetical protein
MSLGVLVQEAGLNLSSVKRIRSGRQRPHPRNQAMLGEIAVRRARATLANSDAEAPLNDFSTMHVYLSHIRTAEEEL